MCWRIESCLTIFVICRRDCLAVCTSAWCAVCYQAIVLQCLLWAAGAVLGSVAGILLAAAMWIFCCRYSRSSSRGQPASIKWPFARQHKGQPAVAMSKEQQMVSKLHSLSMTSSNADLLSNAIGNVVPSEPGSRTVSFNEVGV